MGNINIHNYESFLIDFIEDQLGDELRSELLEFLEEHPEIKAELEDFEIIEIPKDEGSKFSNKDSIKQLDSAYESLFIEYAEGTISAADKRTVDQLVSNNKSLAKELKYYKSAKCEADFSIVYPAKKKLKKYPFYLKSSFYYSLSAAASIILLLGFGYQFFDTKSQSTIQSYTSQTKVVNQLKPTKNYQEIRNVISEGSIELIITQSVDLNLSEVDRFSTDRVYTLRTNIKELQNFAFNYKAPIPQYYLIEKSEFYDPGYYNLVAEVQMESRQRIRVSQAIWKGIFGNGANKAEKIEDHKSKDGAVFWALTSIGVDHINTLTGSDLKLHRKVNEEGSFTGYKISKKEYAEEGISTIDFD